MVDNMKLTQRQQETIDRYHELENKYGHGNVFLRWINNYWNIMFVIHRVGEEEIETHLRNSFKVNGRIFNALEEKGLLQCQDINHNEVESPNIASCEGIQIVGSRIVL